MFQITGYFQPWDDACSSKYPLSKKKPEIIVCDYSIEAPLKLWISENHLPFFCIGTLPFLKESIFFDIFGRTYKSTQNRYPLLNYKSGKHTHWEFFLPYFEVVSIKMTDKTN